MKLVPDRSEKSVVVLSGSPSTTSKTARVGDFIADWLGGQGMEATHLRIRDLPPAALLGCDTAELTVRAALDLVAGADGVVLATPTYKASFSGLLKAFLDLLPQFGLTDKAVMPVGTGGTLAHVLSLDYGFRPVLQSMHPRIVVPSVFLLERDLRIDGAGFDIEPRGKTLLLEVLQEFEQALRMASSPAAKQARPAPSPLRAIG